MVSIPSFSAVPVVLANAGGPVGTFAPTSVDPKRLPVQPSPSQPYTYRECGAEENVADITTEALTNLKKQIDETTLGTNFTLPEVVSVFVEMMKKDYPFLSTQHICQKGGPDGTYFANLDVPSFLPSPAQTAQQQTLGEIGDLETVLEAKCEAYYNKLGMPDQQHSRVAEAGIGIGSALAIFGIGVNIFHRLHDRQEVREGRQSRTYQDAVNEEMTRLARTNGTWCPQNIEQLIPYRQNIVSRNLRYFGYLGLGITALIAGAKIYSGMSTHKLSEEEAEEIKTCYSPTNYPKNPAPDSEADNTALAKAKADLMARIEMIGGKATALSIENAKQAYQSHAEEEGIGSWIIGGLAVLIGGSTTAWAFSPYGTGRAEQTLRNGVRPFDAYDTRGRLEKLKEEAKAEARERFNSLVLGGQMAVCNENEADQRALEKKAAGETVQDVKDAVGGFLDAYGKFWGNATPEVKEAIKKPNQEVESAPDAAQPATRASTPLVPERSGPRAEWSPSGVVPERSRGVEGSRGQGDTPDYASLLSQAHQAGGVSEVLTIYADLRNATENQEALSTAASDLYIRNRDEFEAVGIVFNSTSSAFEPISDEQIAAQAWDAYAGGDSRKAVELVGGAPLASEAPNASNLAPSTAVSPNGSVPFVPPVSLKAPAPAPAPARAPLGLSPVKIRVP